MSNKIADISKNNHGLDDDLDELEANIYKIIYQVPGHQLLDESHKPLLKSLKNEIIKYEKKNNKFFPQVKGLLKQLKNAI